MSTTVPKGTSDRPVDKDKRLYQSVAEQLKALIHEGAFPPDSRLPGERELAERFGVSRVTIREAEIALQALGYLEIKTGSGVYVASQAQVNGDTVPDVTAFELTEARLLFESEAAALAAQEITDEALVELESMIERMSSIDPADEEDSQRADEEFHLRIAASSGNRAVQHIVETLWQMRTRIPSVREVHAAICLEEDAGQRGAEHADILGALRIRDPADARTAMQRHFRRLLTSMIDVTEERALQELRQRTRESRKRYLASSIIDSID